MASFHQKWSKRVAVVMDNDNDQGGVAACLTWHGYGSKNTSRSNVTALAAAVSTHEPANVKKPQEIKFSTDFSDVASHRLDEGLQIHTYSSSRPQSTVRNCWSNDYNDYKDTTRAITGTGRSQTPNMYRRLAKLDPDLVENQAQALEDHETEKLRRMRHQYERELQLQLEREHFREEKQKEYEEHIYRHAHNPVNEKHLMEAVKDYTKCTVNPRPVSSKFDNEKKNIYTHRRVKSACQPFRNVQSTSCTDVTEPDHLRIPRSSSAVVPRRPATIMKQVPNKTVTFDKNYPEVKKPLFPRNHASHFFEWRDRCMAMVPTPQPPLWKMPRFDRNAKSKITTHWKKEELDRLGNGDTQVNVQLAYPHREDDVNVTLQIQQNASRLHDYPGYTF